MSPADASSTTEGTGARALEFYARPSAMTAVGRHTALEELPSDIDGLVRVMQGLLIYDQLAALAREPDDFFDELRERYEADGRLQVPTTVFNAILGRAESI